jgi:hypothetical protein
MHLNTSDALSLIEGRLGKDAEVFWTQHMEVCDKCAKVVLQWRQIAIDLKRSHLMSAPENDLVSAENIFPKVQESGPTLRTILGAIVFDSFRQPAMAAGVRGGSNPMPRQLVMRAEEFDIHVKIWGDHDRKQILGQLLPRGGQSFAQAAWFHLYANGQKFASTTTDETGEFQFKEVPEGDLSLQIDLPNLTVIGALRAHDSNSDQKD